MSEPPLISHSEGGGRGNGTGHFAGVPMHDLAILCHSIRGGSWNRTISRSPQAFRTLPHMPKLTPDFCIFSLNNIYSFFGLCVSYHSEKDADAGSIWFFFFFFHNKQTILRSMPDPCTSPCCSITVGAPRRHTML